MGALALVSTGQGELCRGVGTAFFIMSSTTKIEKIPAAFTVSHPTL